jgi:hypothetical protein
MMSLESKSSQLPTSMSQDPEPWTSMLCIQPHNKQQSTGQHGPLAHPVMYYSTYPSSASHNYYSNHHSLQNFVHISPSPILFSPVQYGPMPLPSASQSRLPTIRGTPSLVSTQQPNMNISPLASLFVSSLYTTIFFSSP